LASPVQENLGNFNVAHEDKCIVLHLDAKSQRQILERIVNFQGKNVAVDTLEGTDIPECIKIPVDSDVISGSVERWTQTVCRQTTERSFPVLQVCKASTATSELYN
jgi:hypothetical protein